MCAAVCQGCLKEPFEAAPDMRITLGAEFGRTVFVSKAYINGEVDCDTQEEMDVNLIRWDRGMSAVDAYRGPELSAVTGLPATDGTWRREIGFKSGDVQYYRTKTDSVGFAGWYPDASAPGWIKEDGKVIRSDNTMHYAIDGKTDVMFGDFAKGIYSSGIPPVKFRHALCLYKIYAYAVDEDAKAEWGDLRQVAVLNFPGELVISLPENHSRKASFGFSSESVEYIMMDPDAEPRSLHAGFPVADAECHIGTVLAGAPSMGILGITAITTKEESGNPVSIARNFKSGNAYSIFLRFSSKGVINAEVVTVDWQYDGKEYIVDDGFNLVTNLSRYGTSNSYIVSSGNRSYCFDATIKGNGVNTLTGSTVGIVRLPDKDVNLTNIDHVEVMRSDAMMKLADGRWEPILERDDRQNTQMLELLSDKLSDGKILFKLKGDPLNLENSALVYKGNVKIGAYDADGNVVWSWHIWITDKPHNQGYLNGYISMDRNLGAVTADYGTFVDGYSHWSGLYYQFGRKDAIYRPVVDGSSSSLGWTQDVEAHRVSVEEAHRHPMRYYYSPDENDWTTDDAVSRYFWGFTSIRDNVVKTLYDPCPPGYRVPGTGMFERSAEGFSIRQAVNGSNEAAGYTFNIGKMVKIYFPNTICIADGQILHHDKKGQVGEHDDNHLYLGVATPYDPALYNRPEETGNREYEGLAWHFRYNGTPTATNADAIVYDPEEYHTKRSAAYPIRCVLEQSAPEVTDLSKVQTANSYVVSSTGLYNMKVNVRGNGVTGLNVIDKNNPAASTYRSFDAGMGPGIPDIDRVDVLWWQGDLAPGSHFMEFVAGNGTSGEIDDECPVKVMDNGSVVDGKILIMIMVSEKTYGNVGLAAYDINDNILWTWHLWIQPGIKVVNLGRHTVMDRNLGATYAPSDKNGIEADKIVANRGFYYQWGRKDPFFPPDSRQTTGFAVSPWFFKDADGNWSRREAMEFKDAEGIPESVKQPLAFFRGDTGWNGNGFWQNTYGVASDSQANDLWGYVGAAGSIGESFAKTMYDPCPPGYKVIRHDVFESANICGSNDENKFYLSALADSDGIWLDNDTRSRYENDLTWRNVSAGGVWFPNTGHIENSGFAGVGSEGRLSTATPYFGNTVLNTREMRWWIRSTETSYVIQQNNTGNKMSHGRAVRCQME